MPEHAGIRTYLKKVFLRSRDGNDGETDGETLITDETKIGKPENSCTAAPFWDLESQQLAISFKILILMYK